MQHDWLEMACKLLKTAFYSLALCFMCVVAALFWLPKKIIGLVK